MCRGTPRRSAVLGGISKTWYSARTFPDAEEARARILKRMQQIGLDDSQSQCAMGLLRFEKD